MNSQTPDPIRLERNVSKMAPAAILDAILNYTASGMSTQVFSISNESKLGDRGPPSDPGLNGHWIEQLARVNFHARYMVFWDAFGNWDTSIFLTSGEHEFRRQNERSRSQIHTWWKGRRFAVTWRQIRDRKLGHNEQPFCFVQLSRIGRYDQAFSSRQ